MENLNTLIAVDARQVWDWAKPRIDTVQKECSRDWRTEDVYAALVFGKARLYACKDESPQDTVFVVQLITNEFTLKKSLFVWVCYAHNTLTIERHLQDLKDIAESLDCVSIQFRSPRPGWKRISGFQQVMADYEMSLEI